MTRQLALVLLLAVIAAPACDDPSSPATGQVTVRLTDAPIDLDTVNAVNVTLDRIILFGHAGMEGDGDGLEMDRPNVEGGEGLTLNLLDFQNGATVTIGALEVPAGDYQKIRMYVREASLVMPDPADPELEMEVEMMIDVPSGKVDIPVAFHVTGGEETEVVLDFDAALSVQVNETSGGNKEFILRPVIVPVGVTQQ